MKTVGVIDYGQAGNIYNILRALKQVGASSLVISNNQDFNKVDRIIIPGVGSFPDAIQELKNKELFNPLIEQIQTKPTLGICLGMQILAKIGFEFTKTIGLAHFDAEVKKIQCDEPVPHMGFNKIKVVKPSKLIEGIENEDFYFMHSYEVVNYENIISLSSYGGHDFVSAIEKNYVYGVQFHPEKSREAGLNLFSNFINI